MKNLRYSPASPPGRGKPPSKKALLRSQQHAAKLISALTQQEAYLQRNLQQARAEAHNANQKLRQLFRTTAEPVEFGRTANIVRCCINVDVGFPYKDVSGLLTNIAAELFEKLLAQAPHLITGADQELLKRVKQIPWKNRAYKTWLLHCHLLQVLQRPDGTTHPENDELASILRHALHAHAFDQLLLLAADHAHLLNENPRLD